MKIRIWITLYAFSPKVLWYYHGNTIGFEHDHNDVMAFFKYHRVIYKYCRI